MAQTQSPINCAFATDLRHLLAEPVSVWVPVAHAPLHAWVDLRVSVGRTTAAAQIDQRGKGLHPYKMLKSSEPPSHVHNRIRNVGLLAARQAFRDSGDRGAGRRIERMYSSRGDRHSR
jgi:hypothetical protein